MAYTRSTGYGPDPYLTDEQVQTRERRVAAEARADTLARLKEQFDIPAGFEELALDIWYDGKED